MADEIGTVVASSDTPRADGSPFADAAEGADGAPTAVVEEQDASEKAKRETRGPGDAGEPSEAQADAAGELKVVVSIKGSRAIVGVQQPSSDPHIESFDDHDLRGLTQEVSAVVERAKARWEESPKHPAYERPAPPARRRDRRQRGAAAGTVPEAQTEQAQQQTLRLF